MYVKKGFCCEWHRRGGPVPLLLRNRNQEISEAQFLTYGEADDHTSRRPAQTV